MESQYHANGTINGTIPLAAAANLVGSGAHDAPRLLGLADLQSLPPRGWCVTCGSEIYRPNQNQCTKCTQQRAGVIDN